MKEQALSVTPSPFPPGTDGPASINQFPSRKFFAALLSSVPPLSCEQRFKAQLRQAVSNYDHGWPGMQPSLGCGGNCWPQTT